MHLTLVCTRARLHWYVTLLVISTQAVCPLLEDVKVQSTKKGVLVCQYHPKRRDGLSSPQIRLGLL